jgi:hypothetical protein
MGGSLLKVLNFGMGLTFVLGAAVQLNDPDPWRWIVIYLAAAGVCFSFDRVQRAWILAAVVGAGSLAWSLTLTNVIDRVSFLELFEEMEPQGGPIEMGRELGGLWIIAAWMIVLLVMQWRKQPTV